MSSLVKQARKLLQEVTVSETTWDTVIVHESEALNSHDSQADYLVVIKTYGTGQDRNLHSV